jgi:hypothetical protein
LEALLHFQQSRRVIEDFTSRTLAVIPSAFGRLYYVSSLLDADSQQYQHDGLTNLYPKTAVQEGLTHCHQELLSRILEMPLPDQERDLRRCLQSAGEQLWTVVESWRESQIFREMCPQGLPEYLSDLFSSNMTALLAILSAGEVNLGLAS